MPKTWPQGVMTAVAAVIGSMVMGQVAAVAMAASMTRRWMWGGRGRGRGVGCGGGADGAG